MQSQLLLFLQHPVSSIRVRLSVAVPAVAYREYLSALYRRRHYQKSFSFISTLKWCAANRRHEYRLTIGPMNEVGLFRVAFLFPFVLAISKTNCPAMLPEWSKHSAGGRSFRASIN